MLVNVKIISCLLCSRLCSSGKCILLYVVRHEECKLGVQKLF